MKCSIETHVPCSKFGEEKGLELIRQAGFEAIDYSFYWTTPENTMLGDDYLQRAAATRAMLDRLGLSCNQAHAPFDRHDFDAPFDSTAPDYRGIARSIEYAAILGAPHIIVHIFGTPEGIDALDYNYRFLKSLEPLCRRCGIRIAVENLVGTLTCTPEGLNAIMDKLDSDAFVTCVDVGHAHLSGYQPEDFLAALRPETLLALHIHDNGGVHDEHTLPWLCKLNWDNITATLARIGYAGDMTLEVFGFLGRLPADLLPDTLRMSCAVGNRLAAMVDAAR